MKAEELDAHMRRVGTWVDWDRTVDQFLAGDPKTEVKGIAVSWMPTLANLGKALTDGCNMFMTHEPLYSVRVDETGKVIQGSLLTDAHLRILATMALDQRDAWVVKQRWLDETSMVVYRCHDFWDDFPEIGIHGAWAKWLGFLGKPVAARKFYEVHEVGDTSVGDLAKRILERVKPLGQEAVLVVGDLGKKASRLALGTGAITQYRVMHSTGADVLLVTDDGTRLWESGQWSLDTEIPLIIVNHSTSEEPGMRTLALYLQQVFPDVHVKEIPVGCIYTTVK